MCTESNAANLASTPHTVAAATTKRKDRDPSKPRPKTNLPATLEEDGVLNNGSIRDCRSLRSRPMRCYHATVNSTLPAAKRVTNPHHGGSGGGGDYNPHGM